jgi:hypothetical protein
LDLGHRDPQSLVQVVGDPPELGGGSNRPLMCAGPRAAEWGAEHGDLDMALDDLLRTVEQLCEIPPPGDSR